ncbi:hypothetical protein [Evansella cellulosilytica]|uniref:Uncharacterized protein n=1 Tax=Evansella cellulosilytica (strain ATCC 21833 / DSM 2522 / FERM P-1141 / JCM 9156 / N-4) TaxID=649639 RepID=E6U134_EVAC2|nr:hypothetical protein [Evansella cellulosilytica]ADU31480.1 hypothetical protein Bcell_3238 [Evansella cellulosilytica DSM 2522]
MKKYLIATGIVVLLLFLITPVTFGKEFSWYQHMTLKISLQSKDTYYEWEYENPTSFEYEYGDSIKRGEKAKQSFEAILNHLDLKQAKITDDQINQIEKMGYEEIERFVVRSVDKSGYTRTWIWKKGES